MIRNARACLLAAAIVLVPAVGGAAGRHRAFADRVHAALTDDGITSAEIADGTISCDDLSPEVTSGCPGAAGGAPAATNVFIDGTQQVDRDLPSTPSAGDPAASIATLDLDEGSYVVFASIVWSGSPIDFSGIVTCLLLPPNHGPIAKAEFIGRGTTTGTLFAQTTAAGPGTVDFHCTDESDQSTVKYRFVQLTAIRVGSLTATKLQ